jgi:hypothetical protein
LGQLHKTEVNVVGTRCELEGTDAEERKYRLIYSCGDLMDELRVLDAFLSLFHGLLYFPLAIWNNTSEKDSHIDIKVIVDKDTADVIIPDGNLIPPDIIGKYSSASRGAFIQYLFMMTGDSDISNGYDYATPTTKEISRKLRRDDSFEYNGTPYYSADDYVNKLEMYIAMPRAANMNEFSFQVKKLKANDMKWFDKGILLRPKQNKMKMEYRIKSDNSNGNISGIMTY